MKPDLWQREEKFHVQEEAAAIFQEHMLFTLCDIIPGSDACDQSIR